MFNELCEPQDVSEEDKTALVKDAFFLQNVSSKWRKLPQYIAKKAAVSSLTSELLTSIVTLRIGIYGLRQYMEMSAESTIEDVANRLSRDSKLRVDQLMFYELIKNPEGRLIVKNNKKPLPHNKKVSETTMNLYVHHISL